MSGATDPEVRRSGIGASDAAKVVGLSRFGDAVGLYMEKIGMTAPLVETAAMRWGNILEEPIAREYALVKGRRVWRKPATLRHREWPFIFCHVDRLAKGPGEPTRVLEVKTAGTFMVSDFGEEGTDQVPADYLIQVQHQLGVTGHMVADLALLIGGQKFAVYTITRDDELIDKLFAAEREFWQDHVLARVPPPLDGGDSSAAFLAATYSDKGETIDADDELTGLAYKYASLSEQVKLAEAAKSEVGNAIRARMGDAARAVADDVTITYREVRTRRTDWEGIVAASTIPPEVIREYTAESASRRLTVNVKEPQ